MSERAGTPARRLCPPFPWHEATLAPNRAPRPPPADRARILLALLLQRLPRHHQQPTSDLHLLHDVQCLHDALGVKLLLVHVLLLRWRARQFGKFVLSVRGAFAGKSGGHQAGRRLRRQRGTCRGVEYPSPKLGYGVRRQLGHSGRSGRLPTARLCVRRHQLCRQVLRLLRPRTWGHLARRHGVRRHRVVTERLLQLALG